MKNVYVKYKILVHGFVPVKKELIIDNYTLKRGIIKEYENEKTILDEDFSTTNYITHCAYRIKNDDNLYYTFFENNENIIIEVPDSLIKPYDIEKCVIKKYNFFEAINNFKKKLRIIYNTRILFPMYKIEIFDEEKSKIGYIILPDTFPKNCWIFKYNEKDYNLKKKFDFSLDSFLDLESKNVRFQRSVNLFNSSFDSEDINVRFLLLFSSIEALVLRSKNNITDKISKRTSRLLKYVNYNENVCERIKKLYDCRSKYIHGSRLNTISEEDEKELRMYIRDAIVIYWMYAIQNKFSSNQIITNLENDEEFDYQTQIMSKYLRCYRYKDAYSNSCKIIKKGIIDNKIEISKVENGVIKSVIEK